MAARAEQEATEEAAGEEETEEDQEEIDSGDHRVRPITLGQPPPPLPLLSFRPVTTSAPL